MNCHPLKLILTAIALSCLPAVAEEMPATTTLKGKVKLPTDVSAGINMDGLALTKAVAVLKGAYRHPRPPYPANWGEMKPEQRRKWQQEFSNSEAYDEYQKTVKAAVAKRFSVKTKVAADGSFSFDNIKPAWYELSVSIMHDKSQGEPNYEHARAHAMHQFFIKKTDQDHVMNPMTLKVKNVILAGDMAPDFTINRYDGGEFKLSDLRGKYLLMDFWATWCVPCIAEIPNLEAAHEKYAGSKFQVMGLSVDQKIDAPANFLKKKPSEYLQGYVGSDERYAIIREAYGITNIPSIWLIGPDGRIIARDLRGKGLQKAVSTVLSQSSAE
ncbi:TlpA family protein disulfide reductase [Verrucomicrobiaceae bacterium R5-34]|nr:TlpA family protein disulfide reductase [Verrucomicrobiaceae bacterium R5-34]